MLNTKKLKMLRLEKEMTQTELAEKLGMTNKIISCYESGRTIPNIETIIKLAEIYNVTVNYLLDLEEKELIIVRKSENKQINKLIEICETLTPKVIEKIIYIAEYEQIQLFSDRNDKKII